ncbi:6-carboxytetrahydropterin synthase [Laceyella putida]|uniref:6-carboxy-5,6,7,8-tetrahydropterin synthase n=1 Tax=Laceyella putida TaxID=110101 RepID=A0ABW2RFE9_9BACL
MIYMSRKLSFSAAHVIRVPSWSEEENRRLFGFCSNPHGHGHDFTLEVMVSGKVNERSGIVVNIKDIDHVVKNLVNEELDGKFLNREHPFFREHVPTTENIVRYLWNSLEGNVPDSELHKIRLWESPFLYSEKEKGSMIKLTRKYHFSTVHRLHSEQLSAEENRKIFGKCNNPHGHGHNYYLDVTVAGELDPITGMVINLAELDQIVDKIVLQKFDHKHLNLDTEEFKNLNPTSENLAIVIWNLLSPHLPNLYKIGLWETEKNYFEYLG